MSLGDITSYRRFPLLRCSRLARPVASPLGEHSEPTRELSQPRLPFRIGLLSRGGPEENLHHARNRQRFENGRLDCPSKEQGKREAPGAPCAGKQRDQRRGWGERDRKSTGLNSRHV